MPAHHLSLGLKVLPAPAGPPEVARRPLAALTPPGFRCVASAIPLHGLQTAGQETCKSRRGLKSCVCSL